jgi:hypothetical protein
MSSDYQLCRRDDNTRFRSQNFSKHNLKRGKPPPSKYYTKLLSRLARKLQLHNPLRKTRIHPLPVLKHYYLTSCSQSPRSLSASFSCSFGVYFPRLRSISITDLSIASTIYTLSSFSPPLARISQLRKDRSLCLFARHRSRASKSELSAPEYGENLTLE